jgi:methyltransferase (TIGR00027 family)
MRSDFGAGFRAGFARAKEVDMASESAYFKPLSAVPDAEDLILHKALCDTQLVTERLGELVPLLKFVGFRVETMTAEKTILTVPLLESAMNQNGTHQAAVFYLIADYTLGVGMFAVLPGCYTVGIHDRCRALPVQFWLKTGRVEHRAPGTGAIRSEVTISAEKVSAMRAQLLAKGRCQIKETVRIYQDGELVALAEHEMGLYADLPRTTGESVSLAQMQRLKTSALMIAGLRGDPVSTGLAGEQGVAVARRMTRASPQLPTLVAARTKHLRDYLAREGNKHRQVLVLGAGLDPKPLEFAWSSQTWFLCDLREMLRERHARVAPLARGGEFCVAVPVDLRLPGWPEKIVTAGFDPARSTLVILEGVSMYLGGDDLRQSFTNIRGLCGHPGSRLWLDHVTTDLLDMDLPEVRSFLSSMARLGEPFVTGFGDPVSIAGAENWRLIENPTAGDVLGIDEAVHREYRFALFGTCPDAGASDLARKVDVAENTADAEHV